MRSFLTESFMLRTKTAEKLYFDYAENLPIIDYHCHLPPWQIADDHQFANIGRIWLEGDHYKWRAMRTNGVDEEFITGSADDRRKFQAFAETVPATVGNPIYHWTHLELRSPLGIHDVCLDGTTAESVWQRANEKLADPEFSARGILRKMKVRFVGTTDDPVDSLESHQRIAQDPTCEVMVRPAFRPDRALGTHDPESWNAYIDRLAAAADLEISSFTDLVAALEKRIEFFKEAGCVLADHGILRMPDVRADGSPDAAMADARAGRRPNPVDAEAFSAALLFELGKRYAAHGWASQFHLGAQRNNNTRMFSRLGADTGYDSIADIPQAGTLTAYLDALECEHALPKTIVYNLNPSDNEVFATIVGSFQDGSVPGKMQLGAAWWFNDQKDGILRHLTTLANMSLLPRFVGMLTDSRSFLSFPRHEYFRRILCDLLGAWAEGGEIPNDQELLGAVVRDICWTNAKRYFELPLECV